MSGPPAKAAPRPIAARRLAGFGTSIFTEMTRLALEHQAVNLGQGFPDFPAPDFVKAAGAAAIAADNDQYAAAPGLLRLRQAVASHFQRRHGLAVDPVSEVTITAGATEAVLDTILALVNPGDEVIVFEPTYDSYVPAVQMAGGVARPVRLHPPSWQIDPDELRRAFSARTRLVVINTPHNPTGKVWSSGELDLLAQLCQEHDALVLADEVYSEITFDGAAHVPMATRPGMRERTVTVDSIGKTFSVTGWKVGWAIAAPALTQAIRGVHQFVTFCIATPLQEAAATALSEAPARGYFDELRRQYAARRERLTDILTAASLPPFPIKGAYFLLADVSQVIAPGGTGQTFLDDAAFCRHLTTEVGVVAIPISAFYLDPGTAPKLARFCFAKSDATLDAAGQRLRAALAPK
jgi:aspartate/methionine/tyrosine aminotransferase